MNPEIEAKLGRDQAEVGDIEITFVSEGEEFVASLSPQNALALLRTLQTALSLQMALYDPKQAN